jgi:lysozyme family protein
LWETVEIRKEHQGTVEWYVKRIKRYKPRYERVERRTGVPWFVVACIHGLECGFDWGAALHNGDKIIGTGEKTTRVPAGRGPFATWEEAAEDALKYDKATEVPVWDVVNTLYFLELFNGTGYRKYHPEVKSPYLWGMTNHHSKGKYVSDGKFDSEAITKQAGAAAILKLLNAFA